MTRETYILAGQSNMIGRGTGAQTYVNGARIYSYSQPWKVEDGVPVDTANPGSGTWALGADPLHSGPNAGVGPGMAFADRLLDLRNDPDLEIGLVPCAWSGSSAITDWEPAYRYWRAFGMCIARGEAAKAWGPIKGVLWYEGETAAQLAPNPYQWVQALWRAISGLRMDLGDINLPVIVTRIGPNPQSVAYPSWSSIQTYTDAMIGVSPKLKVVCASDLTPISAGDIHINAASAVTLGHRYADAMFAML